MSGELYDFTTAVNNAQLLWAEALRLGHSGREYLDEWPNYNAIKKCLKAAKLLAISFDARLKRLEATVQP